MPPPFGAERGSLAATSGAVPFRHVAIEKHQGERLPFVTRLRMLPGFNRRNSTVGASHLFGEAGPGVSRLTWLSCTTEHDFPRDQYERPSGMNLVWPVPPSANCAVNENRCPFPSLLFKLILRAHYFDQAAEMEAQAGARPHSRLWRYRPWRNSRRLFVLVRARWPSPCVQKAKRLADKESS